MKAATTVFARTRIWVVLFAVLLGGCLNGGIGGTGGDGEADNAMGGASYPVGNAEWTESMPKPTDMPGIGDSAGVPSAGPLVLLGAITDLATFAVNGASLDVSAASVAIDGGVASAADLKLGMYVQVSGVTGSTPGHILANKITAAPLLQGTVVAVGATSGNTTELRVDGQRVVVDADTQLDGMALKALQTQNVLVYGYWQADTVIRATRIEPSMSVVQRIWGVVKAVDLLTGVLRVGDLSISYSMGSGLAKSATDSMSQSALIAAKLMGDDWQATMLTPTPLLPALDVGVDMALEGRVDAIIGDEVTIRGQVCNFEHAYFADGVTKTVKEGAFVRVSGRMLEGQVLGVGQINWVSP